MRTTRRTVEQEQARYVWLTPAEAAVRLGGVSAEHVLRLVKDGALRARDVSRPGAKHPQYRIDPDSVEAFNESRMVRPDPKEAA